MASSPTPRPHRIATDIGMRCFGMGLIAIGIGAGHRLTPARADDAIGFLLAMFAFLGLSFGALCTALGQHIFDEVEVSARWRSAEAADPPNRRH